MVTSSRIGTDATGTAPSAIRAGAPTSGSASRTHRGSPDRRRDGGRPEPHRGQRRRHHRRRPGLADHRQPDRHRCRRAARVPATPDPASGSRRLSGSRSAAPIPGEAQRDRGIRRRWRRDRRRRSRTATSSRGNSIHDNGGLGIDLGDDGVGSRRRRPSSTRQPGRIASRRGPRSTTSPVTSRPAGSGASAGPMHIEFFALAGLRCVGQRRGQPLPRTAVDSDRRRPPSVQPSRSRSRHSSPTDVLTATATTSAGTSEFSPCWPVRPAGSRRHARRHRRAGGAGRRDHRVRAPCRSPSTTSPRPASRRS